MLLEFCGEDPISLGLMSGDLLSRMAGTRVAEESVAAVYATPSRSFFVVFCFVSLQFMDLTPLV